MSNKEIFDNIYITNKWNDGYGETKSGSGSTIFANKYRSKFLADFIDDFNIEFVYDAGCGDCSWQYEIFKKSKNKNWKYIGFEVSQEALSLAQNNNRDNELTFYNKPIDLSIDTLNNINTKNSLIIVKDVIQHLTLNDGISFLKNIKEYGIKYIAVSSHTNGKNVNIERGNFYSNNIFLQPFSFINPIRNINDIIKAEGVCEGFGGLIIFNLQEQNMQS